MEIKAAATARRLKSGDTARYPADTPHAIRNPGKADARALLIVIHR
jgi:mannose-6-phosphate isomerase-like protein (cupin superfamily)